MISHPNDSGLAMDQLTRMYTTPHFVQRIDVRYAGRAVLSADGDFSISENPNFGVYFMPSEAGMLEAHAVDNQGLEFATSLRLDDVRGAAAASTSR
jgi:sulfur-oxidizing protein SoxY